MILVRSMEQGQESKLMIAAKYLASKTIDLLSYLRDISQPHIENGLERVQPIIQQSKEFYQDHKEVILIVGVASLTYLIVRPRNKSQQKLKKKKTGSLRPHLSQNKTFISDNSLDELREEPSTTVRVESSGREATRKKLPPKKILQSIQSSSSNESGDKIFFQMYQNYQNA